MNVRRRTKERFHSVVCVVLTIALATGPTVQVWAQQPARNGVPTERRAVGNATLVAAPDAGKIDLKYVTPQAVALVVVHPRQLLTSPATALLPVEVASAAGLEHLGIDPVDVDEVVAFMEPPSVLGLQYGVVIKFAKPVAIDDLPEKLRAHTQPGELDGKRLFQSANPLLPSLFMPDERTLLVMPSITLPKALSPSSGAPSSPLVERVGEQPGGDDLYAVVDVASLRPLIVPWLNVAVMQQREKFPDEAKPFLELPNLISAVDLTLNLSSSRPAALVVHANDAASADRLQALYDLAKNLQRKQAMEGAAKLQQSDDPVERAFGKYIERVSNTTTDAYVPERQGNSLVLFQGLQQGSPAQQQLIYVAVIGILVALLLPAIQAAREAARRAQSMNNLKQLMLSLHFYHDTRKTFPAHASYSADGKPLLSWRVQVLPYLEEQALYNEFHLDEPWDSPHNRKLIARMPQVFANPKLDAAEGKTNYLAVVGEDCIFDGSPKGIGFTQISDGTSKTIALVEANADQAVEWTKPDDWEFDAKNPKAAIGKFRPGGCNAAFADGSVQFISNAIDPQTLKALVTRNGREAVDRP